MESSLAVTTNAFPLEDPLAYLPLSTIANYPKGGRIYSAAERPAGLYLVVNGRVKVSRVGANGRQVVLDIYQTDDIFGEAAFLNLPCRDEEATALDDAKVMTWSMASLSESIMRRPALGVALLQVLSRRVMDFKERIESFGTEAIPFRLARLLCRFADHLGVQEDGVTRMAPLTHELLAQCVGTSREIVTSYMNQLRRQGCVKYSRRGITLNTDALRQWLGQESGASCELQT
jgi:CRP/FNR family transcriptional regulator